MRTQQSFFISAGACISGEIQGMCGSSTAEAIIIGAGSP
jgi:hypothetical protein